MNKEKLFEANLVLFCEKEIIAARIPYSRISFRREMSNAQFSMRNSESLALFRERKSRGEQGSQRVYKNLSIHVELAKESQSETLSS